MSEIEKKREREKQRKIALAKRNANHRSDRITKAMVERWRIEDAKREEKKGGR